MAKSKPETPTAPSDTAAPHGIEPRRSFLVKAAAVVIGGLVALVPIITGALFFFDPLRRKNGNPSQRPPTRDPNGFIKVTTTDRITEVPQKFAVVADRVDAWSYHAGQPIGNVILRKKVEGAVQSKNDLTAFSDLCPHLGCSVDYRSSSDAFYCPCHNSEFALSGEKTNRIPPRALDSLDIDIRNGNEVWVKFQRFQAGIEQKIPIA